MKMLARGALAAVFVIGSGGGVPAQESTSAPLAKQLAAALDAAKLDSIAARDPAAQGVYIAALYFRGFQMLAISARYSAPALLDARLEKREYRDIYIDLNSAAEPGSKVFIEDLGVDGLLAKREENRPFDSAESMGKRTAFDGDWKKQQLTEQEYTKIFSAADERYTQMLTALLAQLKKGT
jgi:hypothetical protein